MSGIKKRRGTAGLTLVELLVVTVMIVILSAAVTSAFIAGIDTESAYARRRQDDRGQATLEAKLTELVQGAILSENTADTSTYFVGEYGNTGTTSYSNSTTGSTSGTTTNTTANSAASGGTGSNTSSDGTDLGCDRLTFTTTAPDVPLAEQNSTDDLTTQQQATGPQGGVAEVSLSTTAVGDAGDQTGLFERIQRPSDADATQGGTESVFSSKIQNMGFQFWDGTEYVDTWDTTAAPDTSRLPAAVLIRYTLVGDSTAAVHELLVTIPGSDVTIDNPVVQTSSTGL